MPRRRIVLLVEPDPAVRVEFANALEARGFQVWAASDGPSGLVLAEAHRPGVVIGDFPLTPDSAFVRAIRANERLSNPVIITVTSRMLTEKDSLAWQLSDRVLAKPIEPERLADEVVWAIEKLGPADLQRFV